MKILKGLEKVAVDANAILSAIIGGKASEVFIRGENISFYTTAFNVNEVEKYVPVFSAKNSIPPEDLLLALFSLPLLVCDEDFYRDSVKKAKRLIEKRDRSDYHLLALALKLACPIWSNDKDFLELGVQVYTTKDLIE